MMRSTAGVWILGVLLGVGLGTGCASFGGSSQEETESHSELQQEDGDSSGSSVALAEDVLDLEDAAFGADPAPVAAVSASQSQPVIKAKKEEMVSPSLASVPSAKSSQNSHTKLFVPPRGQAGDAAAPGLPEWGSKMSYVVRKGETLGKIAKKIYGQSVKWKDMAQFSALKNPNKIFPGDVLYYPLSQETLAFAKKYEKTSMRSLSVSPGETLAHLSEKIYGDASLWPYLWKQNPSIKNPHRVSSGMKLHYKTQAELQAAFSSEKNTKPKIAMGERSSLSSLPSSRSFLSNLEPPMGGSFEEENGEFIQGARDLGSFDF